jgi:hypothetical protein
MVTIQNVISVIEGREEPERYDQDPQTNTITLPPISHPNSNLGKGPKRIGCTNPSVAGLKRQLEML